MNRDPFREYQAHEAKVRRQELYWSIGLALVIGFGTLLTLLGAYTFLVYLFTL